MLAGRAPSGTIQNPNTDEADNSADDQQSPASTLQRDNGVHTSAQETSYSTGKSSGESHRAGVQPFLASRSAIALLHDGGFRPRN